MMGGGSKRATAPPNANTPSVLWRPARQRLAALAVLAAIATGAGVATAGDSDAYLYVAAAYVLIAVFALFVPVVIVGQVVGGQVLAASLLPATAGASHLGVVALVAGVVATAELLGAVARLDVPFVADSGAALWHAGMNGGLAAAMAAAVLGAAGTSGMTGFAAVVLGSAALVGLAVGLVKSRS